MKQRLSIATGGTGGCSIRTGGGIAKVISENLSGVEATAEVTAASVDNLKFLKQGTSDIAFTMADTAQDALQGKEGFEGIGAVPVRTLAVLYASYVHLVAVEVRESPASPICADAPYRRVPRVQATVLANRMLRAAGLNPARDIRTQSLGVAQSVDALKDGKIDAFFWNAGCRRPRSRPRQHAGHPGAIHRHRRSCRCCIEPTGLLYYTAIIPKGT